MYIPKNPESALPKRRKNKKTNIDKAPMRLVDNFVDADKKTLASVLTGKHEIKQINVTDIKDENRLKIRDKYDTETVKQLMSKIRASEELPPVILVRAPDGDLYLVDGYYRLLAHLGCRRTLIRAVVIDGSLNDAFRLRLLANATHPTPLSREEKRRNVRRVLLEQDGWRWSDNIVAPYCGVSSPLVAIVREEILADPSLASAKLSQIDTRLVIRRGKMYEMKVKGINENRSKDALLPEKAEESLEEILHNAQIINNKIKVQPEEVFLFYKDKMAFPHILYVGDAQNKKFLETVFVDRQAGLLKIDFPYRVFHKANRDRCKKANCGDIHTIPNDDLSPDEYQKFVDKILFTVKDFLIPGSAYYIWTGMNEFEAVTSLCKKHLGRRRSNIIWCKRGLQQSFSYYKRGHETAMWGWTGKSLRCWNGGNVSIDVFNDETFEKSRFELARDTHPCPKPVSIYRKMIEDCLEEGGIVLDPLIGSGTTLVAAQLAGRVGVGIELKPEFAAVAVSRMLDLGLDYIRTNLDELPEILLKFGSTTKSVVAE